MIENVRITTLDNGMRVITDTMTSVETVSVGIWVEVGTRHEKAEVNGISHFLEHMAFKGTKRRSAQCIAEEIEAVGGHLNAYTSREHTAYYAKVLKEDLELAIDIIGDILQHSALDPEELARERAVILQEIHQSHDTPDDVVFDHFQSTAYPSQPIGRPVLGSVELVRDMPRGTIVDYMQGYYNGGRMILSAAGAVDHDALVALAEKTFSGLGRGEILGDEPARYTGGDYREARDLEQAHLIFGFQGVAYEDPDFYSASILSTILGGGMSSRLFQEAREKRGLVYNIYTFLSCYTDGGLMGIYAGAGDGAARELIPLICDEIGKIRDDVLESEVARARAQLKASVLMSLESSSSRCEQRARQIMVFDRALEIDEVVEKIEAVDVACVHETARRIFTTRPTFTALGPLDGVDGFADIVRRLA